jgi:hypothetical protein
MKKEHHEVAAKLKNQVADYTSTPRRITPLLKYTETSVHFSDLCELLHGALISIRYALSE